MKLKIRKFDASTIKPDAVVLLIGKRGSGKSTLMKDIMYHMRDNLDFGLAMSPTEETTDSLGSYIPRSCIYNTFSSPALDVMLELQRKMIRKGRFKKCYLLLDDCLFDKKVMTGTNMRELFMNGRHRKIFFMNAVQYMMDMPAALRSQVDYVFALKENIISSREKLWKFFFGMFQDFKDFSKVMNSCTQGYECIVLDNTKRSNEVSDCIYWYAANPNIPDFRMGQDIFWNLDTRYFRDREAEEDSKMGNTVMGVREHLGRARVEEQKSTADNVLMIEKQDATGQALSVVSHVGSRHRRNYR
jgi:energy-coupling factor transporter ATP-binding protein EcfA2